MKKAGIITLNGKHNYGNRLQNYALQSALASLDVKSATLVGKHNLSVSNILKLIVKPLLKHTPLYRGRFQYMAKTAKRKQFCRFDDDFTGEDVLGDYSGYFAFISGSDQVWNPKFAGKDAHFLTFAPAEKRFAYAASFGVSEIPAEQKARYAENLSEFNKISVREDDGKKIVEELTGREDVVVVPDPTMLLTRSDWDELSGDAKPANAPSGKFIVIYALHSLSAENQSKIQQFVADNDYEIYQIMGDLYDKTHKIPDPREFVWLVANAEAVFTDSFHCCVFSIIYHTPFIVFDRTDGQKMSSRLTTLTEKFKLTQTMANVSSNFGEIFSSEDFTDVDAIMSDYREVGMNFLADMIQDE